MQSFFEQARAILEGREVLTEGQEHESTVSKHTGDPDPVHIASHGHEHVYAGSGTDRGEHHYHVHNSQTGKTHTAVLDHGGEEPFSHKEVHAHFKGKVSSAASKLVHKDHVMNME